MSDVNDRIRDIVVVGAGGHGRVLIQLIRRLPGFRLVGYVDPRNQGELFGVPRLGGDEVMASLVSPGMAAAVGIGKVRSEGMRVPAFRRLKELGFVLPVIVSPAARVAEGVRLGEGSVVMDGAIVQPGCVTGYAAIVNTGAILEHDSVLGDDVHVATGAILCGDVSVGDASMIGAGAVVIQGRRIGSACTIGAGSTVTEDCLEPGVYVGSPARRKT